MMSEQFLYQKLLNAFDLGFPKPEMPESIRRNLNPAYPLRPYQEDAFAYFFHYFNSDFPPDKEIPVHLLFNMATGSGKTLIMAGLILYLYEKGYRNFLFFVNSDTIIKKTEDNFLDSRTSKYLFNQNIYIDGDPVVVRAVDTFGSVNEKEINICFTTIQKLHSDLTTIRENTLTLEDFKEKKTVFLADEAHHINVQTKAQQELFENWENTVEGIFKSNNKNLLLEFTATHDYQTPAMVKKYRNKVIYRYDLVDYRKDGFSKEIEIVRSDFGQQDRILQAIIISQYKQLIAAEYKVQLKPVILFKAQRTIKQSKENKAEFHKLIDGLTGDQIERIRQQSELKIVQRAFQFFDEKDIRVDQLAERLKKAFHEDFCLSVNDDTEKEDNQKRLNTLEDAENPIRAIFAVQKLNEGWDVLNLFDIVRCYETRDSGRGKIGKTTISEAQLIGRGARYFPFRQSETDDEYCCRKFDNDLFHDLRVLEELHYHSVNDSRYISEIHAALVEQGMMDDKIVTREMKLKDGFKKTELYQKGVIWLNEQVQRDNRHVESFDDLAKLSVKEKHHEHTIHGGTGGTVTIMEGIEDGDTEGTRDTDSKVIWIRDIERNIVQSAIARNPFFTFASLKEYFPHLTSMCEFMTSKDFLGGLAINFKGNLYQLDDNHEEKLRACCDVLGKIESDIREQVTQYEGTKRFHEQPINAIFVDKFLKFNANNLRGDEEQETKAIIRKNSWFAFNDFYGTSEESAFVELMNRWIREAEATYKDIYLLRNERHFAIYNFSNGRAFEPDFVLFLRKQNGESLTSQLFIEPKGAHLIKDQQWKEDFLKEIRTDHNSKVLAENNKYRIIGVGCFYNEQRERVFEETLDAALAENAEV
ncbi:type III deoxyribonuclease [Candidatus Poribacteria bacterium]|nr:type III deoxyribonuclease [Candidatus Poribacteria bacterium]